MQARPMLVVVLLMAGVLPAGAEDAVDMLLQRGQFPSDFVHPHGYSDFTDPLGRFLDLMAAGAFADARAIKPAACATWLATRENSAFTGVVWIWNTRVSLDSLCASQ